MPGKFDEELADELVEVMLDDVPAPESGPPISTAFHWSGVAQPVTPAWWSASAASARAT
jgi:hypothetical protein